MSRVLGAINLFYWTPTNSKLLATTSGYRPILQFADILGNPAGYGYPVKESLLNQQV